MGAAAYEALLADSRPVEAVRLAVLVVLTHLSRGDEPQAHGWASRAGRVLEEIPESGAYGHFLWLTEVLASLVAGEPAAAVDAAIGFKTWGADSTTPTWWPRPLRRRPRFDQVGRGRWRPGASGRGDGRCPGRPGHLRALGRSLLLHHWGVSRGCRRAPYDPMDRAGRAVAGLTTSRTVLRGSKDRSSNEVVKGEMSRPLSLVVVG